MGEGDGGGHGVDDDDVSIASTAVKDWVYLPDWDKRALAAAAAGAEDGAAGGVEGNVVARDEWEERIWLAARSRWEGRRRRPEDGDNDDDEARDSDSEEDEDEDEVADGGDGEGGGLGGGKSAREAREESRAREDEEVDAWLFPGWKSAGVDDDDKEDAEADLLARADAAHGTGTEAVAAAAAHDKDEGKAVADGTVVGTVVTAATSHSAGTSASRRTAASILKTGRDESDRTRLDVCKVRELISECLEVYAVVFHGRRDLRGGPDARPAEGWRRHGGGNDRGREGGGRSL